MSFITKPPGWGKLKRVVVKGNKEQATEACIKHNVRIGSIGESYSMVNRNAICTVVTDASEDVLKRWENEKSEPPHPTGSLLKWSTAE